jgi:hypothetical protein
MKNTSHHSSAALAAIAATVLILALPLCSRAAEIPAPTETQPALRLQVLESVEVKFPGRSIFYQRVVPPAATAARVPVAVSVAPPLSLAESAAAEARAAKKPRC